jgi:hypothetical protein
MVLGVVMGVYLACTLDEFQKAWLVDETSANCKLNQQSLYRVLPDISKSKPTTIAYQYSFEAISKFSQYVLKIFPCSFSTAEKFIKTPK